MKKFLVILCAVMLVFGMVGSASALNIFLYQDAAPNVYGSPDYTPWEEAAFAAVADGSFVNMGNGINPANVGTTNFEIQDEVVYSFGDLGKRLTWIYWVPGETISELTGKFKISLFNTWDGSVMDFYDYYYGSTWLEPTKWEDYDVDNDGSSDGVIGTAGMAWWGAYGVNTQAALDADIAAWQTVAESWTFSARFVDGTSITETSITGNRAPVPEPATMLLLGIGLIGLGALGRKKLVAHRG